jgi:hypothetical protein
MAAEEQLAQNERRPALGKDLSPEGDRTELNCSPACEQLDA